MEDAPDSKIGAVAQRVLRLVVATSLLMWALHALVVTAFLQLGGVQKLLEATDTIQIGFRRAWSFWPGRVHLTDVRVVMHDSNVQWVLDLPTADIRVSLTAFASRTFHATRLRGEGLRFRFRHKVGPESAEGPLIGTYPPIDGFDDPPIREAGPPEAPIDDAHYNLWTIHMDDVDVGVDELWGQMVRYQGHARVRGAFRLQPARRVWVGPGELTFVSGDMSVGPYQLLRDVRGSINCTVDDFDVQSAAGMEVFRFISTKMKLASLVSGVELSALFTPPDLALADGSGTLDLDVTVDHGVLTPQSSLLFRTGHVGVRAGDHAFEVSGDPALSASGAGPPGAIDGDGPSYDLAHIALTATSLSIAPSDQGATTPLELSGVRAALFTTTTDTTKPWQVARALAHIDEARLDDLRRLNGWLEPGDGGLRVDGGSAVASASMHYTPGHPIDASMQAELADTELRVGSVRLLGSGTAKLEVPPGSREGHAEIALRQVRVMTPRACPAIEARSLSADAQFEMPSAAAAQETSDGRPSWAMLEQARAARFRASIDGVSLRSSDLSAKMERVRIGGAVASPPSGARKVSAQIEATGLELTKGAASPKRSRLGAERAVVNLAFAAEGTPASGTVHVEVPSVRAAMGRASVAARVIADLAWRVDDWSRKAAEVTGRASLRDVHFSAGDKNIEGWWADVELPRVHVDGASVLEVNGRLRASLQNGLPALYMLASEGEIPGFVPVLLPLEKMKVELEVESRCRFLDVRIVEAHGGPVAAEGRLQLDGAETRGAVLVRTSPIAVVSMGFELKEDATNTSPMVGNGWLVEHLAPLGEAAREKRTASCPPPPSTCQ